MNIAFGVSLTWLKVCEQNLCHACLAVSILPTWDNARRILSQSYFTDLLQVILVKRELGDLRPH